MFGKLTNKRWIPSFASIPTILRNAKQRHLSTSITVPIVDLSLPAHEVGQSLHQACTTVGFFYLVNHGVSEDLQQRVLQQSRAFFNLSCQEKEKISVAHSNSYRGYQQMGVNVTREQRDGHEALDLLSESERANSIVRESGLTNHGINQWPDPTLLPHFRSTLEDYIAQLNSVGLRLVTAVSLGLGLGPTYLDPHFTDPYWNMRLIRYPPARLEDNKHNDTSNTPYEYGVGEHTDYGVFTMILCDHVKDTLQIRPKNNKHNDWIMVDPIIPGAFICNLGDMLARWTNNIYVSTPHRVLRPSSSLDRISVPFFFDPNYDAYITPIDELVQTESPRFEPILYGDHLLAKTSQNFKL